MQRHAAATEDESLASLLSLLDGSGVTIEAARAALRSGGGSVEGALRHFFEGGSSSSSANGEVRRGGPAAASSDLEDESAEPSDDVVELGRPPNTWPAGSLSKRRRVEIGAAVVLGKTGSRSVPGPKPAAAKPSFPAPKPAVAPQDPWTSMLQPLSGPQLALPAPPALTALATSLSSAPPPLADAPWKPSAHEFAKQSKTPMLLAAPDGGWTWFDKTSVSQWSTWEKSVLAKDPPSLTLRGFQSEDLPQESTGVMHAGSSELQPFPHDCQFEGATTMVNRVRISQMVTTLLQKVRYPPNSLELSWRTCRLRVNGRASSSCSGIPNELADAGVSSDVLSRVEGQSSDVPADLIGNIPARPFTLLDNAADAPAPQPPHFTVHPLRPEQLRSLSWMLSREAGSPAAAIGEDGLPLGAPQPFLVEWRRYWAPPKSDQEYEQFVPGAAARHVPTDHVGVVVGSRLDHDCIQFSCTQPAGAYHGAVRLRDLEFIDSGGFEVGVRVRVSPAVMAPTYGWGGVSHASIGVLIKRSGEECRVKFPTHAEWRGRLSELARIPTSENSDANMLFEVRARAQYNVRGGILADKIGYGKTATVIGLIDSTLHRPVPEIPDVDKLSFYPTKGTLVIVPSNLLDQWIIEIGKFVWSGNEMRSKGLKSGWGPKTCPLRIFAMNNVTPLTKVSMKELAEADVVICSYRLLFSQVYVFRRKELSDSNSGSLAELAEITRRVQTGRCTMRSGRRGADHVRKLEDLKFPVLEMFYWKRVVFDEFHELESFECLQQNSLQHMRAHYRWGLTGTPPVDCTAGVLFMSSLFRIDIPGDLYKGDKNTLEAWEQDRLVTEVSSSFLETYVRQNTAELPHIRLEEHVIVVRHTMEERALYLGQAHDAPDIASDEAFKTEENVQALERLLKLCSHFQMIGDNMGSAKEECERISQQKDRRVVRARNQIYRCSRVIRFLEFKMRQLDANSQPRKKENWRAPLEAAEKQLGSESENLKKVAKELSNAEQEAAADSRAGNIENLSGHRPRDAQLNALLGPEPSGPAARQQLGTEQWIALDKLPVEAPVLLSLLKGQAKEQASNIQELSDASASLAFFQRTVKTMAEDTSAETRSCTVCMEDGLPLSRLAITPCAHTFCIDCLQVTIARFQSCSICRQSLSRKDARRLSSELVPDVSTAASSSSSASTAPTGNAAGSNSSSSSSAPAPPANGGGNDTGLARFDKYGTKLAAVVQKLQELRQQDATSKVILFVQFDDLKRKVATALAEAGVPTVQLQGAVSQRSNVIHDWQYNPTSQSFVLLLSLAQSASGTNLTAASHVVFLHPMLASTPERAIGHELQAIGRARRHGQKRDTVHVWRFVTADTIEQSITERHQSGLWQRESTRQAAAAAAASSGVGTVAAAAGAAPAAPVAESAPAPSPEDMASTDPYQ